MTSSTVSISLWFRGGLGPGRLGRMAREPSQSTGRSLLVYSHSSGLNSSQNRMPQSPLGTHLILRDLAGNLDWGVLKATGAQQGGDRAGGGSKDVKETRQKKGGLPGPGAGPLPSAHSAPCCWAGQNVQTVVWVRALHVRPAPPSCCFSLPSLLTMLPLIPAPAMRFRSGCSGLLCTLSGWQVWSISPSTVTGLPLHWVGTVSHEFMSTWNLRMGPRLRKRSLQM